MRERKMTVFYAKREVLQDTLAMGASDFETNHKALEAVRNPGNYYMVATFVAFVHCECHDGDAVLERVWIEMQNANGHRCMCIGDLVLIEEQDFEPRVVAATVMGFVEVGGVNAQALVMRRENDEQAAPRIVLPEAA